MQKLTRRDFLKGAALGAASVAAMGAVGVAAAETAGEMTAAKREETKWSFEVPPDPIDESLITATYEHDIIVVGAGMAGMCTAVSAQEAGADVLVLSASSRAISRGGSNHAIGSSIQRAKGIDYSPNSESSRHAVKMELLSASSFVDKRKWYRWVNNSAESMDWMIDKMASKGLRVCLEPGYTDPDGHLTVPPGSHNFYNDDIPFGALFGAPACAQAYAAIFQENGGEIHFNTIGRQLIREDNNTGRVSAVIAQDAEGNYVKYIGRKAIVLATGDFSRDADMMAKYSPFAWDIYKHLLVTDELNYDVELNYSGLMPGDGHKMGLWVGAAWQKIFPNAPMINCGVGGPCINSIDNFWGINLALDGRRYHNEVTNFSYGAIALLQVPGRTGFGIWDRDYAFIQDEWESFGCSVDNDNGRVPTKAEDLLAGWMDPVRGRYYMADTIEELLDILAEEGLNKEEALKSIENYNRYVEQGNDEEFHVNPSVLHPIKTPPFFASKTNFAVSAMTFLTVCGGLRTNEYMQVCDESDQPLEGLYNTGIMTGDFYANTYNFVQPGQNLGAVCCTLSYLLGRDLAKL